MAPKIVPPGEARRTTEEAQQAFLSAYEGIGTISGAAQVSGVGRRTHYEWLAADEDYAARFADAHETAIDKAEAELRRRGIVGVDKAVYFQGQIVGHERLYSDACLIFYLKSRRREVFGDRVEHTGAGGSPLLAPLADVPTEQLLERLRVAHERATAEADERS